jgi:hypothetical protein
VNVPSLAYTPWALLVLPAALYIGLAVAVARKRNWPAEIKLAVAGTGIVLVSTWLISFAALMAFFGAAYIEAPLNALGPVAVDGEMAVGTIVWITVGQGGVQLADVASWRDMFRWLLSPRPYVALLVGAAAALSSVANAAHPYTVRHHWPEPWSYAVSAVFGVLMFAVIHQLVLLFRVLNPAPQVVPQPDPEPPLPPLTRADLFPEPLPDPPGAALPEPVVLDELPAASGTPGETNGRERVTLARATAAYRQLARKGPVTGSALGAALRVSAVMGRNWKRKVEAAGETRRPFRVETEREVAA